MVNKEKKNNKEIISKKFDSSFFSFVKHLLMDAICCFFNKFLSKQEALLMKVCQKIGFSFVPQSFHDGRFPSLFLFFFSPGREEKKAKRVIITRQSEAISCAIYLHRTKTVSGSLLPFLLGYRYCKRIKEKRNNNK